MIAPATTAVLGVTALMTWAAFRRPDLKERWIFNPRSILVHKEVGRMVASGFIHADWIHFAFNAYSFYSFGQNIEMEYGARTLLLVYFASIIGGSILSLIIHRHHDYRALGASGGVCGVIFASIFLLPGESIGMFMLPVGIPAYAYAVLFLAGSFFAHRRGSDNIGHDAHLGGAIVGLLVATMLYPGMVFSEPWMFAAVMGLSLAILLVLILDPFHRSSRLPRLTRWLRPVESRRGGERMRRYDENRLRNETLSEIDGLLDKAARDGVTGLSISERKRLDELSRKIRGEKI